MNNRAIRISLLAAATALIAACSGAPSENDIETLLQSETAKLSKMMESIGGEAAKSMTPVIHHIKINSCDKVRDEVYTCNIDIDATAPIVGRSVENTEITLAKTSDGWVPAR